MNGKPPVIAKLRDIASKATKLATAIEQKYQANERNWDKPYRQTKYRGDHYAAVGLLIDAAMKEMAKTEQSL
jgi:hypothetical protein